MKEFWLRLKSKTPKWARKVQIFFASLAGLGGSILILEHRPELLTEIAEKLVWVGGAVAAVCQFVTSSISKHSNKIDTK